MAREDPFESLFDLEDTYYDEGYRQGFADGVSQSSLEARIFGVEKGFEKFVEMGILAARAKIWSARLQSAESQQSDSQADQSQRRLQACDRLPPHEYPQVPLLHARSRLDRHIKKLQDLVDPASLSMSNSDDAVGDFDERFRHAKAKAKILEKLLGEDSAALRTSKGHDSERAAVRGRTEGNMEDFGG